MKEDEKNKLTPTPPTHLVADEDILDLIRSHRWSQHRKRRVWRVAAVCVCAMPLIGYGAWKWSLSPDPEQVFVAQQNVEVRSAHQDETSSTMNAPVAEKGDGAASPVQGHVGVVPVQRSCDSVCLVEQCRSDEPLQEVGHEEWQVDEIFAEIQSSEYSTIMWNGPADADTIVIRLNSLFGK